MSIKLKLATIALSGAMLISGVASALDFDPNFYVGGELAASRKKGPKEMVTKNGTKITTTNNKPLFSKGGADGTLFVGSRLNENVGVEAGYTAMSSTKYSATRTRAGVTEKANLTAKSRNMHVDVLGFLPVTEDIEAIGSIGAGRMTSKVKGKLSQSAGGVTLTENVNEKSSKTGVRLGAGVGYKFDKNLSARLMVRHQKGNKFIKSSNSAGLGLLYQF